MKRQVLSNLKKFDTVPFLFVGSGISQRYLGLENWEGLLRRFAMLSRDNEFAYEMYLQQAKNEDAPEGLLPKIAELIERDFNEKWFQDERFRDSREEYRHHVQQGVTPFKIEIAKYMKGFSTRIKDELNEEIQLLKKSGKKSLGGIITTNYDCFLEQIYEGYETFIGQEELIFSPIQGIGEIYKIHGCCTQPDTIVITEKDYIDFENKKAYLAAKIMTIFLEHPIIFLGYSISDKNIGNILKAIVQCLSEENLKKLKERLIFVEWTGGKEADSISTYSKSFEGGKSVDMTRIKLNDFSILYEALLENKAKYSAPVLRRLKKDIYDLVLTNKPNAKMRVIGLEDEKLEDIEIVVGVGVFSELGKKGYETFTAEEIFKDIVFDDRELDAERVVLYTLPTLLKTNSKIIPIYKYISQVEVELPQIVLESIKNDYDEFLNQTILKQRSLGNFKSCTINDLRKDHGDMKCLELIALLELENIKVDDLKEFLQYILKQYPNLLQGGKQQDKTNLRRLIRIYDWLTYWKKGQK